MLDKNDFIIKKQHLLTSLYKIYKDGYYDGCKDTKQKHKDIKTQYITFMYLIGKDYEEIGKEVDLSRERVKQIIEKQKELKIC